MRKVASMVSLGRYTVMYDDKAKLNPYRVYRLSNNHRELINKYANLHSAMVELADIAYLVEVFNGKESN